MYKDPIVLDTCREYIEYVGSQGVMHCSTVKVYHGLITAFLERWRREIYSFHLPLGKAIVTLHDVYVLFELCIDGDPVTGREPPTVQ